MIVYVMTVAGLLVLLGLARWSAPSLDSELHTIALPSIVSRKARRES